MRLQAPALVRGLSELETTAPLTFGYNPTQTFFNKGLQGRVFLVSQLARFFKEAIWYMYGCLHTVNHIISVYDVKRNNRSEFSPCPLMITVLFRS